MQFSIFGVFSVLLEVARPFLWIVALVLILELALAALLFQKGHLSVSARSRVIAAKAGLIIAGVIMLIAPYVTGASFASLSGWLDYSALFAAGLAAFVVSTLALVLPIHFLMYTKDKV